jgi:hypothetical protein
VVGDHRLVRSDHRLACTEGGRDERAGRLDAAHEFDDDVDVRVSDDVRRGVGQEVTGQPVAAAPRDVTHGHRDDGKWRAVRRDDPVRMVQQTVEHGAADGARTEHGDAQRRTAHRWGS